MTKIERIGKAAYEGYVRQTGGRSAVNGAKLPTWDHTKEPVREAWKAAAVAAVIRHEEIAGPQAQSVDEKEVQRIAMAVVRMLRQSHTTPVADGPVLSLDEVERRAIKHAMVYTKGDRSVAAELLGIGRTTLYRKLNDIDNEEKHERA